MEKMVARVGNKKGTTMAEASWIQDVEDDLSTWEIINRSDDNDDGDEEENEAFFYDEDEDIFVFEFLPSDLYTQPSPHDHADEDDVDVLDSKDSAIDERRGFDEYNDDDKEEEEEEVDGYVDYDDDDDDDDGGYEYDLDDNLVPKSVSNRFGGQRMKKLGKRASPKMNNSKKLPYYYFNRPGFVHGKN